MPHWKIRHQKMQYSGFPQNAFQFHNCRPLCLRGQMGVTFSHFQAAVTHETAGRVQRLAHLNQPRGKGVT